MNTSEISILLASLHAEAERLASIINAPKELCLQQSEPIGDGFWLDVHWLEARYDGDDDAGHYLCLMCKEDGVEWGLSECRIEYSDYILFTFCKGLVHTMAHRKMKEVPGSDRRMLFSTREGLMAKLNAAWLNEMRHDHERIISIDPIID